MENEILQLLQTTESRTWPQFLLSIFLCVIFAYALGSIYKAHANRVGAVNNTADLLPLLSLTVFLVIITVKQSLALSLGLVGALSIVRFRTPVKEPEDLIYFFISIGIGVGFGANQILLSSAALIVIYAALLLQTVARGRKNNTFIVRINAEEPIDSDFVYNALQNHCKSIELNRQESSENSHVVLYSVVFKNFASIQHFTDAVTNQDAKLDLSIIEFKGHW